MDEKQSNMIGLDSQIQPIRALFNSFLTVWRSCGIQFNMIFFNALRTQQKFENIFLSTFKVNHRYENPSKQKCRSVLLNDIISYVTCLSVRFYIISCNMRQFKVYERLSRLLLRYYADISPRSEPCFHHASRSTEFLLVFKLIVAISLPFSFSPFRIFPNSSTMQFRVYVLRAELRYEMSLQKCWAAELTNEFWRSYTS